MTTQFEIQARIVERRAGVRIRDGVRLAAATILDHAIDAARTFAADGYTVWIFSVERSTGRAPSYRLIERIDPPSTGHPTGTSLDERPAR